MKTEIVKVPSRLDLENALFFSNQINSLSNDKNYTFDFSDARHFEPFGMLLTSQALKQLSTARLEGCSLIAINFRRKELDYAAHMGFFKAFGLEYGKEPGQATGSHNYIPLTRFLCAEIEAQAASKGDAVGDEIENQCLNMAGMLSRWSKDSFVQENLVYCMREMLRNVVEHAESESMTVCAQHWPSKFKVEVAILDGGVGLSSSLSNNPHLKVSSEKDAINLALLPAVSGKAFKGSRQKKSVWANSGFGLYMTSRVSRNGGNFFICSNDHGLLLTRGVGSKKWFSTNITGTGVRMVIDTRSLKDLNETLKVYREEGLAFSMRYKETVNINPSVASMMLTEDFNHSAWEKILAKFR